MSLLIFYLFILILTLIALILQIYGNTDVSTPILAGCISASLCRIFIFLCCENGWRKRDYEEI